MRMTGLMMALSIPVILSLIQSKGAIAWVYRVQLLLAGTTVLLMLKGSHLGEPVALLIVPLTHSRLTARQRIAVS